MKEGKAIISPMRRKIAGFTYIESWGNKQYVATSGLIVHPNYWRMDWDWQNGIKQTSFKLARLRCMG